MSVPEFTEYAGDQKHNGLDVKVLFKIVNGAVSSAQEKLKLIKENKENISIGDMFEMQMLMNHLSQLSEMSTATVAAFNACIMSMTRNLKQ